MPEKNLGAGKNTLGTGKKSGRWKKFWALEKNLGAGKNSGRGEKILGAGKNSGRWEKILGAGKTWEKCNKSSHSWLFLSYPLPKQK